MKMAMYNYDLEDYDYIERLPDTKDGLMPYVPTGTTTAARDLFALYIDHMDKTPFEAYKLVLLACAGVGDKEE